MDSTIFYICDREACEKCNEFCFHTTDITHAKNFIKSTNPLCITEYDYWENDEEDTKNELTLDELRDSAEKLGYKLVKKRTYISLKPCPICGRKHTAVWHSMAEPRGVFRQCEYCDFRSDVIAKKSDLNQAWNDTVDRYLKEKED